MSKYQSTINMINKSSPNDTNEKVNVWFIDICQQAQYRARQKE